MPTRARNTAASTGSFSRAQGRPHGQAPCAPLRAALGPRHPGAGARRNWFWARQVQAAESSDSGLSEPGPGVRGPVHPGARFRARQAPRAQAADPSDPAPSKPEPGIRDPVRPGARFHARQTQQAPRAQAADPSDPEPSNPGPSNPGPSEPAPAGASPAPALRPSHPVTPYSSPTHPFAPPRPRPAKNLLMACQAAGLLSWEGRTMAAAGWHMRGDRGNAFPRWTVSRSGAARHLVTMAKTLARCSCRRDYDGSLHVTALTLADLKSHQKLHLGRPDES